MKLKNKILLCALTPILLLGIVVIFITSTSVKDSIITQVKEGLRSTANTTLAAYSQNSGSFIEATNGEIWKGAYNISQSETLVDTIAEKSGMDVTFFYGSKRIMTSAKDSSGNRILGSPAGNTIVSHVLENGEEYFSDNVSMDGTIYYGFYVPVYQSGDESAPIGMVFAGKNRSKTLSSAISIIITLIIIVIAIMIICTVVVFLVSNSISKALLDTISVVEDVSSGKLNVTIEERDLNRSDEIGVLANSISRLQEALRNIIGGISDSANLLMDESDSLKSTSHDTYENIENVQCAVGMITDGTAAQADNTITVSENVSHMGELITSTSQCVSELNMRADNMLTSSDKTFDTIKNLKEIASEVNSVVNLISEQTEETNKSAKLIQEASNFISEIADQTNLLSLNASIEAARAGEAGRGFAVVAGEIQTLADQSNKASGSITQTVNTLISNFSKIVDAMKHMQDAVQTQNGYIDATEATVNDVISEIRASINDIRNIEVQSNELENARSEIADCINSLSGIAETNVSSTEETSSVILEVSDRFRGVAESADTLKGTADRLVQNISSFEL